MDLNDSYWLPITSTFNFTSSTKDIDEGGDWVLRAINGHCRR
ncbi:hypothetical protein GPAL_3547 [Glaciecola pallidula DSM 14239 = ACAM 615]|uniref:Uncharacterized protein n=1 Tax=Brumicola pallidula DSM 14239 = ACAM 615 TaxID=1121922 RepID=K6ZND2_9ALTE|nr:hypothetical protein GPAL_3547 [Glaciecola pallidula DSM 14239 = ACAM 615]